MLRTEIEIMRSHESVADLINEQEAYLHEIDATLQGVADVLRLQGSYPYQPQAVREDYLNGILLGALYMDGEEPEWTKKMQAVEERILPARAKYEGVAA